MSPGSHSGRYVLFGAITVVALFLVVELTLRLFMAVSFSYLNRQDDLHYEFKLWQMHLFDSFMGMHQPDPELFWRMKPDFRSALVYTNSDGFVGEEIPPKEEGEFRILFLGDSTPLGLGLADFHDSFVFGLEKLLKNAYPRRPVRVINTATAGYSSWQCRRLLERRGKTLQPDVVITYFGNNDPSINGFLSDHELYRLSSSYGTMKRILARSYIYRALKWFWLRWQSGKEGGGRLKVRVSPDDFRKNLLTIKEWCDGHNCKLALCTVPTPDLWPPGIQFKVFSRGKDAQGRLVMADRMRSDITARWSLCLDTLLLPGRHDLWTSKVYASAFADTGDLVSTERFYQEKLSRRPHNAQFLNNLGVLLWRRGEESQEQFVAALARDSLNPVILYNLGVINYNHDRQSADHYLHRARELDHYSLRIKSSYNQTLRQTAATVDVQLIDFEGLFAGLPETYCYVDHCHPTLPGHKLMAEKLFKETVPLLDK
ncbi:MAG: hypothetical protein KAT58_03630 [candidate division Zixibacteria bacterium]|nr:hypothetical protein [candidate division Zixibacteria bacterium]